MGARVLVVDDDSSIVRVVAANLRVRGYEVLTAASGEAALRSIKTHQPDCIVLDLGLPGINGLEVLRRLRTWATTPVVILTAIDGERDKATALDLGADDYVTKPFGMAELLTRVRDSLGHDPTRNPNRPRSIQAGDINIDLDAGRVTRGGQPVQLTRTEYRLLEVLATNAGRLCIHRFLLECVWGRQQKAHYLRVHMAKLRHKLEDDPSVPRVLLTEPGIGYRLVLPERSGSQHRRAHEPAG
jgi:two-component system, OmpR family, KDP operon response regulator KdpE